MKLKTLNYHSIWWDLVERFENVLREKPETRWQGMNNYGQHFRQAFQSFKLYCLAERIATDPKCPWGPLSHTDALRLAVLNKHHWTLAQVRALEAEEDFLFLLQQELIDLVLEGEEEDPVLELVQQRGALKDDFAPHLKSLNQ
ncbi:hypothetical protein C6Y56_13020 [Pseudomonas fluorescens]|uniref:Uncharacterized protein n=1 Tax=Pseudomonas fluorescens TaxID=294 RepID=A0A7Z3C4Q3_PSEFL|nr:hypothetical protein C6Y56_13020 [Pseudomonas fluorescens]